MTFDPATPPLRLGPVGQEEGILVHNDLFKKEYSLQHYI